MTRRSLTLLPALAASLFAADFETGAVKQSDGAQFDRNTIPQVARLGDGRLFAVWGVYAKGSGDGRIYGAFSQDSGKTWSDPRLMIDDPKFNDGDPNILVDGSKVFVYATRVTIPNDIFKSRTTYTKSEDNGQTWSPVGEISIPRQYTPGKQHNGIRLSDGTYCMGISWDLWPEKGMRARTEGEMNLASGVLRSTNGVEWTLHGNIHVYLEKLTPFSTNGLAEPSLVELEDGEILMYLRSGGSRHYESRSRDGGLTWSAPVPSPLVGHNTPTALWRLQQNPKEIVAVWNSSVLQRFPLSVAVSSDGGRTWSKQRHLANPGLQASYPGLTQAVDGTIVAVWQQALPNGGRDIRWARFTREWALGLTR
ncbi:MAG: exo-alpha-sialidase [Bryobacterales bacterium]|nr:exo-alpha-sialidase [Bryobacterales bacterium]